MTAKIVDPYQFFTDRNGDALDGGYVYVGVAGQDPELSPQACFFDKALTIPATQPLRTIAGYIVNPGAGNSPSDIFIAGGPLSIRVRDKQLVQIFYKPNEFSLDASIIYVDDGAGGTLWTSVADFVAYLRSTAGAAVVGFSQSVTYALGNVGRRLKGEIFVTDAPFNAVGDGVADDTAALNAAYAYAQSLTPPGCVYHPRGKYLRTAPPAITKAITLTGAGPEQSIIVTSGNVGGINVAMTSSSEYHFKLSDIGLLNTSSVASASAGTGLNLSLAYLAEISNVKINGFYDALHITQSPLTNVRSLHIDYFKNDGIRIDGGNNFDVRVHDFTVSAHNIGARGIVLIDQNDEHIFSDGVVSECTVVQLFTDAASYAVNTRPEFCRFTNISFDNGANGIDLGNCTDMLFDGCFFSCRPGYGARVGNSKTTESVTFDSCTWFNNGTNGLQLGAFQKDTRVIGGQAIDNSQTTPATYHGILAIDGATDFSVIGTKFKNGWGGGTQQFGLYISGAACNRFVVSGCNFGTATGSTFVNNSTGNDQQVYGNIGYRTTARGTVSLVAGTANVAFPTNFPAATFSVILTGNANETFRWSAKAVGGFTITSSNVASIASVDWSASF
jgi:Pectate lyase superfamily protein